MVEREKMKSLADWGVGSRGFHLLSGGLTFIVFAVVFTVLPSTRADPPTIIGVAGSGLTLFALLVAMVEIARLEGAADQVAKRVESVIGQLRRERDAALIAECQSLIVTCLRDCDTGGPVGLQDLARIIRLYKSIGLDGQSAADRNTGIAIVTSYASMTPYQRKNTGKLRIALMSTVTVLGTTSQDMESSNDSK